MRNITRCDICNLEVENEKPRVPKGFVLINGLDFCNDCYKEYKKRNSKIIKDLQIERFTIITEKAHIIFKNKERKHT